MARGDRCWTTSTSSTTAAARGSAPRSSAPRPSGWRRPLASRRCTSGCWRRTRSPAASTTHSADATSGVTCGSRRVAARSSTPLRLDRPRSAHRLVTVDWLDELQLAPGPPWHAMGTRALDESRWLLPDEHRDVELAAKRRLVDQHPDVVVASVPGSDAAAAEVADVVADASSTALDRDRPPLVAAALAVQEDLCVLERSDNGRWRLTAGVVCFPSMWALPDKIGLPLAEVHGPVPAYADELADRVDRFVDRLRPDRPVWRRNWLIHASDELHLPEPPPPPPPEEPPDVPDGLWLRSERQTLRRLPRTGAVAVHDPHPAGAAAGGRRSRRRGCRHGRGGADVVAGPRRLPQRRTLARRRHRLAPLPLRACTADPQERRPA